MQAMINNILHHLAKLGNELSILKARAATKQQVQELEKQIEILSLQVAKNSSNQVQSFYMLDKVERPEKVSR